MEKHNCCFVSFRTHALYLNLLPSTMAPGLSRMTKRNFFWENFLGQSKLVNFFWFGNIFSSSSRHGWRNGESVHFTSTDQGGRGKKRMFPLTSSVAEGLRHTKLSWILTGLFSLSPCTWWLRYASPPLKLISQNHDRPVKHFFHLEIGYFQLGRINFVFWLRLSPLTKI